MLYRAMSAISAAILPFGIALGESGEATSYPVQAFIAAKGISECDSIAGQAVAEQLNSINGVSGARKISWISTGGNKGRIALGGEGDAYLGVRLFGDKVGRALETGFRGDECPIEERQKVLEVLRARLDSAGSDTSKPWVEAFLNDGQVTLTAQPQVNGEVVIAVAPDLDEIADELSADAPAPNAEGVDDVSAPKSEGPEPAPAPAEPSANADAGVNQEEPDPLVFFGAIGFGALSLLAILILLLMRRRARVQDETDAYSRPQDDESEPEVDQQAIINEIGRLRNDVDLLKRDMRALKDAIGGGDAFGVRRAPPPPPPPPPPPRQVDFAAFRHGAERDYQRAIEANDWSSFQTKYPIQPLARFLRLPPDSYDWHGAKVPRLSLIFPDLENPTGAALIVPDSKDFVDADEGRFAPSIGDLFRREPLPESRVIMRTLPKVTVRGGLIDEGTLELGLIACPN